MANVALYTFGVLKDSYTSETLKDFSAAAPSIFTQLAATDGFISHAGNARPDLRGRYELGQDYGPWGIYVIPRFYGDDFRSRGFSMIQTLSLWRDLDAAHRFSYGALHRAALKRRGDWFVPHEGPGYVLWWVADGVTPTWSGGAERLEMLADKGPTAFGFDFKHPCDEAEKQSFVDLRIVRG